MRPESFEGLVHITVLDRCLAADLSANPAGTGEVDHLESGSINTGAAALPPFPY
ncbi:MAG: hypothetical protein ACJAVM_003351 [Sulfitobacter sp.]|jgi:hypothetical protein